jgi:hypothetical protein
LPNRAFVKSVGKAAIALSTASTRASSSWGQRRLTLYALFHPTPGKFNGRKLRRVCKCPNNYGHKFNSERPAAETISAILPPCGSFASSKTRTEPGGNFGSKSSSRKRSAAVRDFFVRVFQQTGLRWRVDSDTFCRSALRVPPDSQESDLLGGNEKLKRFRSASVMERDLPGIGAGKGSRLSPLSRTKRSVVAGRCRVAPKLGLVCPLSIVRSCPAAGKKTALSVQETVS